MAASAVRWGDRGGWAIALTAAAVLLALAFLTLPPSTWIATETPIVVGWLAMLWANGVSRRLRAAVATGAMTRGQGSTKALPFLFILPAAVGAASGIALAVTHALGLQISHMSFLLPYATAFWGLVLAGAACLVHAILVGNTRVAS